MSRVAQGTQGPTKRDTRSAEVALYDCEEGLLAGKTLAAESLTIRSHKDIEGLQGSTWRSHKGTTSRRANPKGVGGNYGRAGLRSMGSRGTKASHPGMQKSPQPPFESPAPPPLACRR